MSVTPADIRAMGDVLRQLCEESDQLDDVSVAQLLAELDDLRQALGLCRSLLVTRGLSVIEAPVVVGHRMFVVRDKTVRRDHHHQIAEEVVDWALVDRNTGQVIRDPHHAVSRAVEKMLSIYVSPSTTAKKSALAAMAGVNPDALIEERKVEGRTVDVIEIKARD